MVYMFCSGRLQLGFWIVSGGEELRHRKKFLEIILTQEIFGGILKVKKAQDFTVDF